MCGNPRCSKLLDSDFSNPSLPLPSQGFPSPPQEPGKAKSPPQTHLLALLRTQVQQKRKLQSKLTARSNSQCWPVRDRGGWGSASLPAAPRNARRVRPRLPLLPAPPYLRSRARHRSARRNPNPCWRPRVRGSARVCGALGAGVRLALSRALGAGSREAATPVARSGQCAAAAARGGSAEASAARARLPAPAGRCLRARRARGGGWGAPGESRGEGGKARAGRSGSGRRLPGSRLGLNTPGAVSLLLLALHARRPEPGTCGARARS